MATVIIMCLGMIWGVIYLITGASMDGKTSIIIMDVIVFVFCVVTAGGYGVIFGVVLCLVLDLILADALVKTSTPQNIKKTNQQTKKEDKEHNDWGYIEWEVKDR